MKGLINLFKMFMNRLVLKLIGIFLLQRIPLYWYWK